jgi:hypothetical protein
MKEYSPLILPQGHAISALHKDDHGSILIVFGNVDSAKIHLHRLALVLLC